LTGAPDRPISQRLQFDTTGASDFSLGPQDSIAAAAGDNFRAAETPNKLILTKLKLSHIVMMSSGLLTAALLLILALSGSPRWTTAAPHQTTETQFQIAKN